MFRQNIRNHKNFKIKIFVIIKILKSNQNVLFSFKIFDIILVLLIVGSLLSVIMYKKFKRPPREAFIPDHESFDPNANPIGSKLLIDSKSYC